VRHGQGYSVFECASAGIALETTFFADRDERMKLVRVRIRNGGRTRRRLRALALVEWQMGAARGERRGAATAVQRRSLIPTVAYQASTNEARGRCSQSTRSNRASREQPTSIGAGNMANRSALTGPLQPRSEPGWAARSLSPACNSPD